MSQAGLPYFRQILRELDDAQVLKGGFSVGEIRTYPALAGTCLHFLSLKKTLRLVSTDSFVFYKFVYS